jgi:glucuronyl/N-acetylglucosaminyl transferase EXT1
MRVVVQCIVLMAISISVMLFYGNIVSHPCLQSAGEDSKVGLTEPYTLSMPPGNCNCTVFYSQNIVDPLRPATPSLYCQCEDKAETGSNVTLACPKPEARIVEKEVIREVEKECPRVEPQIVEKEVIKEVEVEKECPPVPWHAQGRNWHYPASFPLCSMDTCFDYSRCDDAKDLLIYTYYHPLPPPRYLAFINESKWHTDDPSKACLFLVPFDHDFEPWHSQDIKKLPYWNHGMNHLLLTWSDKYSRYMPTGNELENASIIASDLQETTFRPGFDISIPLPGSYHQRQFQSVSALDRKYLATFKGLRYLGYKEDGTFRSAKEFREMHNGQDVIVSTSCQQATNNYLRKEHPELGVHCDEDQEMYPKYNYVDLMNTTFGFVPAGRQPASYRFIEVLSAGVIPVLIADNYVKPFDSIIPWYTCLVQFPTHEMHRIVNTLRSMSDDEKLKRQKNCLRIYEEYLKDHETLLRSVVRSLKARFLGALPNLSEIGNRRRR